MAMSFAASPIATPARDRLQRQQLLLQEKWWALAAGMAAVAEVAGRLLR